jgi:hypothetical protein
MKNEFEAQRKQIVRAFRVRENQLREGGPGSGRRASGAGSDYNYHTKMVGKRVRQSNMFLRWVAANQEIGKKYKNKASLKKADRWAKLNQAALRSADFHADKRKS